MKTMMLFTGGGPLVIMTSHRSVHDPNLIEKLRGKGVEKFIAFDVPVDLARERYGMHFQMVAQNLHETDDLRVLDYNGQRAMQLFRFDELGAPLFHEPGALEAQAMAA